jgi:hypothetical protein
MEALASGANPCDKYFRQQGWLKLKYEMRSFEGCMISGWPRPQSI